MNRDFYSFIKKYRGILRSIDAIYNKYFRDLNNVEKVGSAYKKYNAEEREIRQPHICSPRCLIHLELECIDNENRNSNKTK